MMKRPPQASLKTLQKQVDGWNATVPVGTLVEYRSHPGAAPRSFSTATAASILSGHTAVVWLDGKSGCVAIAACKAHRG